MLQACRWTAESQLLGVEKGDVGVFQGSHAIPIAPSPPYQRAEVGVRRQALLGQYEVARDRQEVAWPPVSRGGAGYQAVRLAEGLAGAQ